MSAANTSAPCAARGCRWAAFLATTRTFFWRARRFWATTCPVLPLAPRTTYIINLLRWIAKSYPMRQGRFRFHASPFILPFFCGENPCGARCAAEEMLVQRVVLRDQPLAAA